MNYRHIFHAGSFTDVMKHTVVALILDRLRAKETPFGVLDTHAGIGRYDLTSQQAGRTGEYLGGISRVMAAADRLPTELAPYLNAVREINPEIPEWFEAIIRRLHAKNPVERFQTAEELAELLEECLSHVQQPTVVPLPDRISIPKQREISTDRTKKLRTGVLAMIATVAVGLVVSMSTVSVAPVAPTLPTRSL